VDSICNSCLFGSLLLLLCLFKQSRAVFMIPFIGRFIYISFISKVIIRMCSLICNFINSSAIYCEFFVLYV
jgi:hypothetical protein